MQGSSLVDEALITGEPLAVQKEIDDNVIGGTLNKKGSLIMKATHVSGDTMLSQIVALIEEAQTSKVCVHLHCPNAINYVVLLLNLVLLMHVLSL